ncbi:MAG: hypothetical protein GY795_24340 [Desulfobacterales bacterium]|nr:hypothetical protein [Desulfobacterales bacterium]
MTTEAIYDGKAFIPVDSLSIRSNTRVKIFVITQESEQASFLEVARSLELEGPEDWSWSVMLDEYLTTGQKLGDC